MMMGLFSKKVKQAAPSTPAIPPPSPSPSSRPLVQASAGGDLWKRLQEARDFVDARPTIGTHDLALIEPTPGAPVILSAYPDGAGKSVAEVRANLFRTLDGKSSAGGWIAVHLPQARGDLWLRATPQQTWAVFRAPGAAPQPIRADDPRLKELPAAAHCKSAHSFLGGLYQFDASKFELHLKSAEALWPGYPPARRLRAEALKRVGDAQGALRILDDGRRQAPGDAEAHYMAADTLDDLGRAEEALSAYDAAVRADPAFAGAWRDRGVLLSKMGRSDDALASYGKAIALDPGDPLGRTNAAVLCFRNGRHGDAYGHLARMDAKRVAPGSRPHQVATTMLAELSQGLVSNQQWDAAIGPLELWAAFEELDPRARHALGLCYLQTGRRENAVASFRMALAKDPSYDKPRRMLKELGAV